MIATMHRRPRAPQPGPGMLLTANQAARLLGITEYRLTNLRKWRKVSAVDLGPGIGWRYARPEVEKMQMRVPKAWSR